MAGAEISSTFVIPELPAKRELNNEGVFQFIRHLFRVNGCTMVVVAGGEPRQLLDDAYFEPEANKEFRSTRVVYKNPLRRVALLFDTVATRVYLSQQGDTLSDATGVVIGNETYSVFHVSTAHQDLRGLPTFVASREYSVHMAQGLSCPVPGEVRLDGSIYSEASMRINPRRDEHSIDGQLRVNELALAKLVDVIQSAGGVPITDAQADTSTN